MVHFTKLSLAGFKSFADTCDVDINPGLTGIVGPNGCGKSNLVESLRWIMGENSAKRMRGGDMDDVIFAGTVTRPPRNQAEVKLVIDNRDRSAPEIFNKDDTLEITRKIERGNGSAYRVNGKLVRARDVQMLFADTASGANSPAIVSQGRVADIIHAKPTDRRKILEDAAAISGLNTRRKEAEQRLQAAEKNLIQVDDILGEKEKAYQAMRKQARQALRYREISADIRQVEGALYFNEWQNDKQAYNIAKEKLHTTHETIETHKLQIFELKKLRDMLQQEATEAQAAYIGFQNKLEGLNNDRQNVIEQIEQLESTIEQTQSQITQIAADIDYETAQIASANEKLHLLDEENKTLSAQNENFEETREQALRARDESRKIVEKAQEELNALMTQMATQREKYETLTKQVASHEQAINQLNERLSAVSQEKQDLENRLTQLPSVQEAEKAVKQAQTALDNAKQKAEKADTDKQAIATRVGEMHAKLQSHETTVTRLKTETTTISSLLQEELVSDYPPVLDSIRVTEGYEKAVSVALGRELNASLDNDAPTFWQQTSLKAGAANGLPSALKPLNEFITVPAELDLAISQIAVAEDDKQAIKYVSDLSVGQWIVTREGSAWRWDGYTINALALGDSETQAASVRLEQRNRLEKLTKELAKAERELEKTQSAYTALVNEQKDCINNQTLCQTAVSEAYKTLDNARNSHSKLISEQSTIQSSITAVNERINHFTSMVDEHHQQLHQTQTSLAALPPMDKAEAQAQNLRSALQEKQITQRDNEERYATINADFARRQDRMRTIETEKQEWHNRITASTERKASLALRLEDNKKRAESFAEKPQALQEKLAALNAAQSSLDEQEQGVKHAWEDKAHKLNEQNYVLLDAEEAINQLREEKARSETAMEALQTAISQLEERAQKQFNCPLGELVEKLAIDENILAADKTQLETRLEKLMESRERLGAINLRADEDAKTLFEEIEALTAEKDDIINAIAELRQAISKLNSDARRRLTIAFNEVNRHFSDIFARLFGGGKAYLELTDANDPLESGLEIFASPPGKKLQNLSLLSGGEQSLTAIALIFAMFRTTPSPICILDEIDAPLDDANVTRICDLLQDFTRECDTRFIIISHNAITMAKMHRLYGVTMGERGVSKLVSVDLQRHLDFMDTDTTVREVA